MNAEYALILEDDEINAELIKTVIENMGYETQCYPYFIITDINMPIMNGMEFARIMKKAGYNTKYIAIISAKWSQQLRQEAEAMGCQIFHKPYSILSIKNWILSLKK